MITDIYYFLSIFVLFNQLKWILSPKVMMNEMVDTMNILQKSTIDWFNSLIGFLSVCFIDTAISQCERTIENNKKNIKSKRGNKLKSILEKDDSYISEVLKKIINRE